LTEDHCRDSEVVPAGKLVPLAGEVSVGAVRALATLNVEQPE